MDSFFSFILQLPGIDVGGAAETLTMTMEQVMVTAAMLPWEMVSRLYG